MMTRRFLVFLVVGAVLVTHRSEGTPQSERIQTVTRLVQRFSELEATLMAATAASDAKRASALLSKDFEMRVGSAPGDPLPRDAWLARVTARPAQCDITSMAARDLVSSAVVSFRCGGSDAGSFIVDIWVPDGDAWKLQVRFASPAARPLKDVPGAITEPGS